MQSPFTRLGQIEKNFWRICRSILLFASLESSGNRDLGTAWADCLPLVWGSEWPADTGLSAEESDEKYGNYCLAGSLGLFL